jgi:hypothetical protein
VVVNAFFDSDIIRKLHKLVKLAREMRTVYPPASSGEFRSRELSRRNSMRFGQSFGLGERVAATDCGRGYVIGAEEDDEGFAQKL